MRAQAAELERVRDLSSVLSSEHLKLAPTLQSRLQDLCQIHVTQQDQTGEQSEELKATLQHYNNAVSFCHVVIIQCNKLYHAINR